MSQNSSSNPPLHFVLIDTDRIGDTILTLPSVSALRKKYPGAFIVFLAQPYTAPLIEQYEGIDLLLTYDPEGRHQGWPVIMWLSGVLEQLKINTALLFFPRAELAFALFKAKIQLRIGTANRWYSFLLNQRIFLTPQGMPEA
jgi:heptosyltransferase-2